jgi:hypothetical protein
LDLYWVDINDETMQKVLKFSPHLQSLKIDFVSGLTENAFAKDDGLGAVLQLHTVDLPANLINDEVIKKMQLPKLRHLTIYKQKVN